MNALETTLVAPFAETENAVRAALVAHGFGVLTEIDVAATLKTKLGVERPALKILGACNPHLAHQALELDPSVSLVLPCNVVIQAVAGGTRVAIADPRELLDEPALTELASAAADALQTVLDELISQLAPR